jgi:hypothetical protein
MIRAAVRTGIRPSVMILGDPYAGHRCWWDAEWKEDPALVNVPTGWDIALIRALQIIEDYTGSNGQLIWIDSSKDVDWDIRKSWSGHDEAIERATKDAGELDPGVALYAVPVPRDPANPPTLLQWAESMAEEELDNEGDLIPVPEIGKAPTHEELLALRALREAKSNGTP